MVKKALIIWHNRDFDGLFSYLISKAWLEREGYYVDGLGYDYSEPVPDYRGWSDMYTLVMMVDISFQEPADMMALKSVMGPERIIWEDHHLVSIQKSIDNGYDDLKGHRENGISAAEICWLDLFPGSPVPLIVQYVSAHDVWNKERFDWNNETEAIQSALYFRYGINPVALEPEFRYLLSMGYVDLEKEVMKEGRIIRRSREMGNTSKVARYAFEVKVGPNRHPAIAIMNPEFGSTVFDSVANQYSLFLVTNRVEKGRYKVSLYADETKTGFNCGEYLAQKYNGGGHKGAASCIVGIEEFIKILEDEEF